MNWPSLAGQRELALALFGSTGKRLLDDWLDEQTDRKTNPEFARQFTNAMSLPNSTLSDFNHRLVSHRGRHLLGGIRFYGGHIDQPFVEVVAHNFDDLDAMRDCVAFEWADFNPGRLRLLVPADEKPISDAMVDTTVFAARYEDMSRPGNDVHLTPFDTAETAIGIIDARYAELKKHNPELAMRVYRAESDDVRCWHKEDAVRAICTRMKGRPAIAGLLAILPGNIEWLAGDVIHEEVILSAYAGNGLAAAAQMTWAAEIAKYPDRYLLGTIDQLNEASRRTARRSGRRPVLDYLFLPLSPNR